MRILLLGGSGRLGGAFRRMLGTAHELIVPASRELDVTDARALSAAVASARPDWVVNLAAYNNVDGAEGEGAEAAMLLNARVPGELAAAAAAAGARFLHLSTDYVFGGDRREGYAEDDEPAPISAYGISKHRGELAVVAAHPGAHIVRTSRLYGPKGESAGSKPSFVEIVMSLASGSAEFAINDAEVSAPTNVDELARHLQLHVLEADLAPGVYHAANQGGCTWREWAEAIVEDAGLASKVLPRDPAELRRPAARPAFSVLRSTKLPAMRSWRDALRDYLRTLPRL